ncbi:MAG: AMP-binding protein, partial [bacterium]|nr:AMP-binding protein [bacterium]
IREQTNYDFNIIIVPGKRIKIKYSYNTTLYEKAAVEQIRSHLKKIITQVVENPQIHVKDIQIVTEKEKAKILHEFNDTAVEYPREKTIHQLFEEQVERAPDKVAIVGNTHPAPSNPSFLSFPSTKSTPSTQSTKTTKTTQLTYRELNKKSNQLAAHLFQKGVQPGAIVALKPGRTVEMIVGLMGILKTGAAYLPIDPIYPAQRIRHMLADSNTRIL